MKWNGEMFSAPIKILFAFIQTVKFGTLAESRLPGESKFKVGGN